MKYLGSLPWTLGTLLIILGKNYGSDPNEKNRNINQAQPRMSSEEGNLIFHAGSIKNIEFRTGLQGRIKVNEEDLADIFSQVQRNKDEILELKRLAILSHTISSQVTQLQSKIVNMESRLHNLEQMFLRKTCNSNPCQNSGTCINLLDDFFCLCPSNWQGPICSDDINECQIYAESPLGCQNGATCINTPGGYSCTCTPETYGPHCASKFDDCQGESTAVCKHGLCVDRIRELPHQPKYICICDAGWMSPPGSVACSADIDECSLQNPPCSQNPPVLCFNTPGSYNCGPCPTGYEGDGKRCTQLNMCSANNGGCHPLAQCVNISSNTEPTGTASTIGPEPNCICPDGYTGNGYGSNGCVSLSTICQRQNPCQNGQCLATVSGYICDCDSGWSGVNCTDNFDECSSNPCQHGGSCIDGVNGYSCECTDIWTGLQCQIPQQACGGSLVGLSGTFSYPNKQVSAQSDQQVNCNWVVRTNFNKVLRITFPFFQLEGSSSCRDNFLQIHDGESTAANLLGNYCGSRHPPNQLFSSHNSLYFSFHSDRMLSGRGFTVHWESQQPECGGKLTSAYGSISSPGFPGNYPPNRDCYWIISTHPAFLITFAFGTLSLEHHDNCSQDYLEIHDGFFDQDPLLGKYCSTDGTGLPPPLQTTGPYGWVHFHSDSSATDRGFHITYTTAPDPNCGGIYTDSSGIITSPNWPESYLKNRQCVFIIQLPLGEKIEFRFTHLEMESHLGCSPNYMEIRDGNTEGDPLIDHKFCGNVLPPTITSNKNSLWIKFKSDTSATRSKFRAVYKLACGGPLSGDGVIRSPYFSRPLPDVQVCEWSISQPEHKTVVLNFTDFRFHDVTTCNSDYVEIRDGSNADSPFLGKYCGAIVPSVVQSTYNYLYIKFSGSSMTNLGFVAEYKSSDAACGGTLTEPIGTLASPGYLNIYPHDIDCRWTISVQLGYLIQLTFTNLDLEFDYNCSHDYLDINDGTTTKLGRYCGRSVPPSILSTGNTVSLHFVTNHNISSKGFSINYTSLKASTVCLHEYTGASGVVMSPDFPDHYPNRMTCIYKVQVANHQQIALHFTDFSLENGIRCLSDYVEIRDGGYETSPLLGKYCGSTLPPVTISHSNNLWIKFVSDVYNTNTGFSAYWNATATGCSRILTSSSGMLMSPNYPMPYHHNADYYWLLKSSHGSPFEISFEQFHLDYHLRCQADYLAIYDGNSTDNEILGKFCGNQVPPKIQSTRDNMYIELRTDNDLSGGGFLARFKQVCQGIVIAGRSQGILESLNYPNNYPPGLFCNWTIQTTAGNTLNYSFTTLSTRGGENCHRDHLKLYDGPDAQSDLIGIFCGESIPPSGGTNSSSLHVEFFSDKIDESTGFQMLWNVNVSKQRRQDSSGHTGLSDLWNG